jgi:hypothetical protein
MKNTDTTTKKMTYERDDEAITDEKLAAIQKIADAQLPACKMISFKSLTDDVKQSKVADQQTMF